MKSIVKFTLLLLIALSFSFFAPAASLTNSFAPPETVSAARINHGMISYNGRYHNGWGIYNWAGVSKMMDNYSTYRSGVRSDFQDIKNYFGAKTVRFIAHPMIPAWGNEGLDFPTPRSCELTNLGRMIDDAYSRGLTVFLVMVLPPEYWVKHPDTVDNFYANNGVTLMWNLFTFWDNIFNGVLRSRMNKIYCIDIMGDFDVGGRYYYDPAIQTCRAMTTTERNNHREWWRRIWPNFRSWYGDFIPPSKKTFEIMGDAANPVSAITTDINWCKNEIQSHGWIPPLKYSFEGYAWKSWADGYSDWYNAFYAFFSAAKNAAGGWDKIMIEEMGVNRAPSDPLHDGYDQYNNPWEGEKLFSASFAVIANFSPSVPLGVWCYHDAPDHLFGLLKVQNVRTRGHWVLPYYWK